MWILVGQKEYFIDHDRYPWFREATIAKLAKVEITGLGSGLFWPDLDVDVELEALEYPDRYPLIARVPVKKSTGKTPKKKAAA